MATNYERRDRCVQIAEQLAAAGFQLFGMHEDRSDFQTDYYAPAYWEGIAKRGDVVVTVNAWPERSGKPIEETRPVDRGLCPHCGGTGRDPSGWTLAAARRDPERYARETTPRGMVCLSVGIVSPIPFRDDGSLRCRGPLCLDGRVTDYERVTVAHYPVFAPLPKGKAWSVQRGGKFLALGTQLSSPDSVARKILAAAWGLS